MMRTTKISNFRPCPNCENWKPGYCKVVVDGELETDVCYVCDGRGGILEACKYRRKSTPEIEAFFWDTTLHMPAPTWVLNSLSFRDDGIFCTTESGVTKVKIPTWLVREPSGIGAYPVSVEYFENNFEISEK